MEGIVLKVQSYKEYDRLAFVYTPKGKLTLVARGAERVTAESRVIIQYLNLISFKDEIGKSMHSLKEATLINEFPLIKDNYKSLELASILLDLVNLYVYETDQHEIIFELLKNALTKFNRENVLSFGFKLLKYLGYQMNLIADGRNVRGFNIKTGSLVYFDDSESIDLDLTETIMLLKLTHLPYDKIERIDDFNFNKLKSFMYDYFDFHTNYQLKRK